MTKYAPNTWADNNASYPLSAARMTNLELGIQEGGMNSADYVLVHDGSQWLARNGHTGLYDFTGSDFATVFNQASAALTKYGLAYAHTINASTCYYAFPPAPTVGTITGSGGAVDAGDHYWSVSFVSAGGESITGYTASATLGAASTVALTIPTGPAGTTSRNVYRTVAGTPAVSAARDPDLSELFLVHSIADNTTTSWTDNVPDATASAANSAMAAMSLSDGGSIRIARSDSSYSGIFGATSLTQTLQMYPNQQVWVEGRASRFITDSSATQQYGTMAASYLSTDTTITVTETTTPPPTPFLIGVNISGTTYETMLVTARTAGSPATYTVQRGYGWWSANALSSGKKVYGSAQGRGRLGATVDMYPGNRCELQGMSINGANTAVWGILYGRFQNGNGSPVSTNSLTSGANNALVARCEMQGAFGPELAVGKPNDPSATAGMIAQNNTISGTSGVGLGIYIGDGFYRDNNILGIPPIVISATTVHVHQNHLAPNGSTAPNIVITSTGRDCQITDNYVDNVNAGGFGAIYRASGGSTGNSLGIKDNYFNTSSVNDGTAIINILSTINNVQVTGNTFGGTSTTNTYTMVDVTGSNWEIDNNVAVSTNASFNSGSRPGIIGKNVIGSKLTSNAGAATASGNGSTTAFSFNHGLTGTPNQAVVTAASSAAAGNFYVTSNSTQITVTYTSAPANGSNNLTWNWSATV